MQLACRAVRRRGLRPSRTVDRDIRGVRAVVHSLLAVTALTLLLLATMVLLVGCGDPGDDFVGRWTNDAMMGGVWTITRDADVFTIDLMDEKHQGGLDGDVLLFPADDPDVRFTVDGDEMVGEFVDEGRSMVFRRVD